tara:strand:+ start:432 stop:1451 length:1020 start_codon:yes stop_codon:yes gene_type:complete
MKKNSKFILITGVAGFIGFHLSRKLIDNNFKVIGIDNINNYYGKKIKFDRLKILSNFKKKNFVFFKKDLKDKNSLNKIFKSYKIQYVVNLAAQAGVRYSLKNPQAYIDSNIQGFFNILDLSRKYEVKHFIYASTSSVYGMNKKIPFAEKDHVNHPLQLYASTKRSNELIAHAYSNLYNLPTTGLRFFTVYGPWGRPDMALFIFVKKILENKSINIFNYGNHVRDFTYIDDIVDGIKKIIFKIPKKNSLNKVTFPNKSTSPFRILNIGNGKPIKLKDFINEIEKNLGKRAKKKYLPLQKGDVIGTHSNINEINKLTKYKPKYSYKLGIKKFINWYLDYYK